MFVGRHNASAVADNVAGNARMNKAGEMVSTPWELQMMLEGRVFVAGTGCEETGIAGIAALDVQTPVFGLTAPAGGIVAIPLWFKVYYDTEAGAAPAGMHLVYIQKDRVAFSAGTLLPAINALGGDNPRTAQAKFQHTLTALTDTAAADNVMLTSREHILDDLISTEGATGDAQIETLAPSIYEMVYTFPVPIGLYAGSGIYWYGIDATSRFNAAAAWIEVPASVYKA